MILSGIDIVVAGGGHEGMGDSTDVSVGFNGHDADFIADAYPITTTDIEYTYLGLGLTVADVLGEQKAFQDFLAARHPSHATAYNIADTPVALDTRFQQFAFRSDSVLSCPATFAAWLASNGFTSTGIDTDTDGLIDRVEYFFNLHPNNAANVGNLPSVALNGANRELHFSRLSSAFGIDATLLYSTTLQGAWPEAVEGVDYEIISETPNGDQTDVSYRLLGNDLAKFFRFEVK